MTTEYKALAGKGGKYTRALTGRHNKNVMGATSVLGSNGLGAKKTLRVGTFGATNSIPTGEKNRYQFRVTGKILQGESNARHSQVSSDGQGISGVIWGPGGQDSIVYTGKIIEDSIQLGPQLSFQGNVQKVGDTSSGGSGGTSNGGTSETQDPGRPSEPVSTAPGETVNATSEAGIMSSLPGNTLDIAMLAGGGVLAAGLLYYANK